MPRKNTSRLFHHAKTVKRELKNHFIPHKGNNYHPHVLQHHVLFGFSAILVLLKVLAIVWTVSLPYSSIFASGITPANIVSLTNQTRQNLALGVLKVSNALVQAAQQKAQDMVAKQYFSHTGPGGATFDTWIDNVGYAYQYAGENLAVHYDSAEGVSDGWLASPTHKKNIVKPEYTEIGVGVASGEFEGAPSTFVVQFFGKPVVAREESVATAPSPTTTPSKTGPKPVAVIKKAEPVLTIDTAPNNPNSPQIHDDVIAIKEDRGEYNVKIAVDNATSVQGQVAGQEVVFTKSAVKDQNTDKNQWTATIPVNTKEYDTNGEDLVVVAGNTQSAPVSKSVAVLAPSTSLQNLYGFTEQKNKVATFLGVLNVGNLGDSVRRFYLYFIVFLGATLLLNVFFVKLRLKHPTVLAHSLAVIVLACVLYVI
ncbi:MAG: CAP domain-containing protein [bacterium]|nr:CAP domain-containing protein [bacterium]